MWWVQGPLLHGLTLIPARISNHLPNNVLKVFTFPFPQYVESIYFPIPKMQCWSLGMNKQFHPTLDNKSLLFIFVRSQRSGMVSRNYKGLSFIPWYKNNKINLYLLGVSMSLNVYDSKFPKLLIFWMWRHYGITLWCHGDGFLFLTTPSSVNCCTYVAKRVTRFVANRWYGNFRTPDNGIAMGHITV